MESQFKGLKEGNLKTSPGFLIQFRGLNLNGYYPIYKKVVPYEGFHSYIEDKREKTSCLPGKRGLVING